MFILNSNTWNIFHIPTVLFKLSITEEIGESSAFADRIIEAITRLEVSVEYIQKKLVDLSKPSEINAEKKYPAKTESQVKLPKITLKEYDGSLSTWSTFWGQYDVAVHTNMDLSEIQKFTYLRSYLTADAERSIRGLTLIKDNYEKAINILKFCFGNKQLRLSAHMNELRNLKGNSGGKKVINFMA